MSLSDIFGINEVIGGGTENAWKDRKSVETKQINALLREVTPWDWSATYNPLGYEALLIAKQAAWKYPR